LSISLRLEIFFDLRLFILTFKLDVKEEQAGASNETSLVLKGIQLHIMQIITTGSTTENSSTIMKKKNNNMEIVTMGQLRVQ
jgi:hypothetical protein